MTPSHTLDFPARQWVDGHILGNGDVGAVVWGDSAALHVGLSKHDVNDLRTAGSHGLRWTKTYPEILREVAVGRRDGLMEIGGPFGLSQAYPIPLACGRLTLELLRGAQEQSFAQTLDFAAAECRCHARATGKWGAPDAPLTARVLVHARQNLVLVELASAGRQRIGWRFDRQPSPDLALPAFRAQRRGEGCAGVMLHDLPEGLSYAVAVGVRAPEQTFANDEQGLHGTIAFGGSSGDALLILALTAKTHADGFAPAAAALKLLNEARGRGYAELTVTHREWWRDFWSRSDVKASDAGLELLWTMGLYALGSCTRPDKSPPHLQGIWNQHDVPPWHADFHFNVNVQECHWAAGPANHPELQAALVRVLVHDWRDELRRFAREQYEAPGLAVPFCTDWKGRAIHGWPLASELCNTAWAAQHVWWQWLYTADRERLQNEWYPFLCECCEFYRHILVRGPDGIHHIALSHSPEQEWHTREGKRLIVLGRDPTIDIAFIRNLFRATVAAAELLGLETPALTSHREIRDRLPPYPTHDGFLIDQAVGFFDGEDRPGWFPWSHRHPSRLTPVFPCDDIGLHSDPQTLALGQRSFDEFRRYGDGNFTGWSEAFQACIAARLGLADEAAACLRRLVRHYSLGGMLLSHDSVRGEYGIRAAKRAPIFQIDATLGAAAGMQEMLLQHTGGALRVFPALPADMDASFRTLRAPGGLLVSARRENGVVAEVAVLAERAGEVRLINPWLGRQVKLQRAGEEDRLLNGDILVWTTQPGHAFRLCASY